MKPDFSRSDSGINKAQRCKKRAKSTRKKKTTQINRCDIFIVSNYAKSMTVMGEEEKNKKILKRVNRPELK